MADIILIDGNPMLNVYELKTKVYGFRTPVTSPTGHGLLSSAVFQFVVSNPGTSARHTPDLPRAVRRQASFITRTWSSRTSFN